MQTNRMAWGFAAALGVMLIGGLLIVRQLRSQIPSVPAMSSSVTVLRPNANVLAKIRDLKRFETVSFHMERVIDLSEKQSQLFGLLETEDALLLVAAAEVRAGVDLEKLEPGDITVDLTAGDARVRLPKGEVFGAALDNKRTYVHTRKTGMLARRQENLETKARQEAERALLAAATEAGIVPRAEDNAVRLVSELVRSLGYEHVDVAIKK